MSSILSNVIFSDLNRVPIGGEALHLNGTALQDSLHNLLTTEIGQRHNLVAYGINLEDTLFEQIDDTTSWTILQTIFYAVNKWEPRVTLLTNESSVTPNYDDNSYTLQLRFAVVGYPGLDFSVSGVYKKLNDK